MSLRAANTFVYLSSSGCTTIEGVDDSADFHEMLTAMQQLGFSLAEIETVFRLVAGILHLGNIVFRRTGDRSCAVDPVTTGGTVRCISQLFQVESSALEKSITMRTLVTPGQPPIDVGLSLEEATSTRDALAKFLFDQLFNWLVVRINKAIGGTESSDQGGRMTASAGGSTYSPRARKSIGILDIFGFEIFTSNGLEQLCINWTNEKLQQVCVPRFFPNRFARISHDLSCFNSNSISTHSAWRRLCIARRA